jgi:hypothetical protein
VSTLVVVPSALRQSRVRRRLCDAEDGVLLGPRVTTLRGLVPGLLAAAGEGRVLLSPFAERVLALEAVRAVGLAPEARGDGAARAAAAVVAEARGAEVSPSDLRGAAAATRGRAGERLEAVARALAAYEQRLREAGALDAAGALRAAADAAGRGASSEETRDLGLLVLEGLLPAGRAALDLGMALASRARSVHARIPYLPEEPGGSSPAAPWVRRVEALHELSGSRDLRVEFPASGRLAAGRAVRLPAQDDEGQADAAARLAGELLDGGMDAEDVVVFAPDRIRDLLPAAFARLEVPLAAPSPRPLAGIPLVRDVRAALSAAAGLDRVHVEALLSLPAFRAQEPGRVRWLLDRAGALEGRGDPEDRLRARAAALTAGRGAAGERRELLALASALHGLRRALEPLREPATASEWAARVRSWLSRSGTRRRAAEGDPALVRRDVAALSRLEDVLDDVAASLRAAGRAGPVSRADYLPLLDLALAGADVPSGHGPAAGAVEAWPLEEAPGLLSRAAIVLGAGRGSWPGSPGPDPVLGNGAREALRTFLGRRALPTARDRQAEAELRGLWALTAPSDVLAVSWNAGPDREGPAPLAARFLDLAGANDRPLARDPALPDARGAREALRAAGRLAASGRAAEALAALPPDADLPRRGGSVAARGAAEGERRRAWVDGAATPFAGRVPPELGDGWRAGLPAQWSPTDLEIHASCPFRYLLRGAGVAEEGKAGLDIEPRDEGALLHAALEAFVRARRDRGAWPPEGGDADREEARTAAAPVLDRFEAEGRVGDPATWAARREALLRRLDRFVEGEAARRDGLAPVLVEHDFGGASGRPPLAVPSPEGEVLLQGRIDRVDADAHRLLVVDYKNARGAQPLRERLSPGALGVTSFQAPVYLLAAARELPGRDTLAATFALLRSDERVTPWTTSPGDPFLAMDLARRAEVRAAGGRTLADGVVDAVSRIRGGALPVAPRDCTFCPYGAVCRFPRPGEA